MSVEILIVLILTGTAVVLFATEILPIDLIALLIMAALLVTGIISPEEGFSGFSNIATITVGAMFVLSAGLVRTGAVNFVGSALTRLTIHNVWLAVLLMMLTIGLISAFINNTAAVIIFLPIVITSAREANINPSKFLMPLSFASMFGGVCTLIGTSTNILVNSIAKQHGEPGFGMFEFARLGVVFFAAGILYMIAIGIRLIPDRRREGDLTQTFRLRRYLTEIVLLPESKSVGKRLADSPLVHDVDIDIIDLYRNGRLRSIPEPDTLLAAGDILHVRCDVQKIKELQELEGIVLKSELGKPEEAPPKEEAILVEAAIAPNSTLEGKSLKQMNFRRTFGATALAIRHRGELFREKIGTVALRAGDALLIKVKQDHLNQLKQHPAFVLVSEVGLPKIRKHKVFPALAIIGGVVAAATFNVLPISTAAIIGSILLILTGCITLEEAYNAIEWKVIFLLAGVLTLGVAMEKTGSALLISHALVSALGTWGPVALVSAFFLITFLLTGVMSNNATAALLAPIAIVTADSLGLHSRPFLMAVTFAASASFMTPVGYQTNTLIYGPGQYKFIDFVRVGTPLNLILWALATFLIPYFWPL